MLVDVPPLRSGGGSGRGKEKRREDWRSRAVGELTALDIVVVAGGQLVIQCHRIVFEVSGSIAMENTSSCLV